MGTPRPVTRLENIIKAIAALTEDPAIDALCADALGISKPVDKRTGTTDPTVKKGKR
jgi:hypothetical protein